MNHCALTEKSRKRRIIQSILWVIVPITIIGGLKYPLLGFAVPVVMLVGIVGGFFRGRFVCGWLCPRGAFFDRVVKALSPRRSVPAWLRSYRFRWIVFALLMGFMVIQLSQDPSNVYHWGTVFVSMCVITTAIGVILALIFHPRTWCSFCPVGTLQSAVGGSKSQLTMADGCRECRICEKSCPMDLKIVGNTVNGKLASRDCLKCPECQVACPIGILSFE